MPRHPSRLSHQYSGEEKWHHSADGRGHGQSHRHEGLQHSTLPLDLARRCARTSLSHDPSLDHLCLHHFREVGTLRSTMVEHITIPTKASCNGSGPRSLLIFRRRRLENLRIRMCSRVS
jgi:hypothetical protein